MVSCDSQWESDETIRVFSGLSPATESGVLADVRRSCGVVPDSSRPPIRPKSSLPVDLMARILVVKWSYGVYCTHKESK
jgi:hypothetical protein